MNLKQMHREAMKHFNLAEMLAKTGDTRGAFDSYEKAADIETEVAESYFKKPELEPTRSILIRSAAFINLKAGRVAVAQRFIYFGLLNLSNQSILEELKEALKLSISLEDVNPVSINEEYSYLAKLKEHSRTYRIEPVESSLYGQVTATMIVDFFNSIQSSYQSYLKAAIVRLDQVEQSIVDAIVKHQTNFRVLNNRHGSFEVELVNDFIPDGTSKEINNITKNSLADFSIDVLENPLDDEKIDFIKKYYSEKEVNEIYGPIIKARSDSSTYNIEVVSKDRTIRRQVSKVNKAIKKKVISKLEKDPGTITSLINTTGALTSEGKTIKIPGFTFNPSEAKGSINQLKSPDKEIITLSDFIVINLKQNLEDKYDLFSELSPSVNFVNLNNGDELKEALVSMEIMHYLRVKHLLNLESLTDAENTELNRYKDLIGDINNI